MRAEKSEATVRNIMYIQDLNFRLGIKDQVQLWPLIKLDIYLFLIPLTKIMQGADKNGAQF